MVPSLISRMCNLLTPDLNLLANSPNRHRIQRTAPRTRLSTNKAKELIKSDRNSKKEEFRKWSLIQLMIYGLGSTRFVFQSAKDNWVKETPPNIIIHKLLVCFISDTNQSASQNMKGLKEEQQTLKFNLRAGRNLRFIFVEENQFSFQY